MVYSVDYTRLLSNVAEEFSRCFCQNYFTFIEYVKVDGIGEMVEFFEEVMNYFDQAQKKPETSPTVPGYRAVEFEHLGPVQAVLNERSN